MLTERDRLFPVKRNARVNYDEIQKAMEDVRRDRFDYFLDLETSKVVVLSVAALNEALTVLYGKASPDYDRDVVFDSEVNLDAELSDRCEETLDVALSVLMDERRYVRIPERNSREAFSVMKSFASTVQAAGLRRRLEDALNGAGSFKRFKDALLSDKKERKRWHGYNAKAMRRVIAVWLSGVVEARPGNEE
ncbi:MAG: hypothetical protein GXO94_06980 [Nitrospirae bacterium]|nr:hypothetical protein [Nitrospirota bacterium]